MTAAGCWALAWAAAAAAVSWTVITTTSRVARPRHHARPGSTTAQLAAGTRMGLREADRNRMLWTLLIAVPVVFIILTVATTPEEFTSLTVRESCRTLLQRAWLPDIHGGTMAPIAIASLAMLAGLFTVLNARAGDQRLSLAGFRPTALLASRLTVVVLGALLATAASLAATATVFDARQWGLYIAANVLIALTYGLIGVLLGPLFGRVGGVLIAFLVPFIDLGIEQSPMLRPDPPGWAHALPGYGAGVKAKFSITMRAADGLALVAAGGELVVAGPLPLPPFEQLTRASSVQAPPRATAVRPRCGLVPEGRSKPPPGFG
ncbi:hypothetical protein [Streptomyces dysideae]|uniref:hypothetical protein n=1 Tax=Streptomyces dysideae TaxID=909626 RepID=UPI0018FECFFA|nr:hypothetical protein [Streptomyces dysideae]